MEQMVFSKNLSDEVSSVSDRIGLHNLQKHIGNFLIIEPYVEWKGGYSFFSSLKAFDAHTGEIVLHLENTAFNWSGLDQPLFFPLLNGLVQWIENQPIPEEQSNKQATK